MAKPKILTAVLHEEEDMYVAPLETDIKSIITTFGVAPVAGT